MKIVIDGFGGDNSPNEVLKGARMAVDELDVEVVITGDKKSLLSKIQELEISDKGITVIDAQGVISVEDNPAEIRKSKANSSMGIAFGLLKAGEADAFVSAGSTAAIVVGGSTIIGRIKGIKRASLAPIMPSYTGQYMLFDGGANLECRPEMLLQFAIMGKNYMQLVHKKENPKIGLFAICYHGKKLYAACP